VEPTRSQSAKEGRASARERRSRGRSARRRGGPAVAGTETQEPFPVVGIGASAGGLEALERLLRALPADPGLAFLVVQHLDPRHPSRLRDILARATAMPVEEARNGMPVKANCIYTIPPGRTMLLRSRRVRIEQRAEGGSQFMPVDALFRSLAREERNRAIGVILSGAASDGAAGAKEIKHEGGITFAQDADSARYTGMPNAAVATGAVDLVMPPEDIARALARLIHDSYVRRWARGSWRPTSCPRPSGSSSSTSREASRGGSTWLYAGPGDGWPRRWRRT
jgi:chemotaxis response regulator CheB